MPRRPCILDRAARKMLLRQLSGAFYRWSEMAVEAKEMRVKLERCARKIKNKSLYSAFER